MTTQSTEPNPAPDRVLPDETGVPLIVTRPADQSRWFTIAMKERFGNRARLVLSPLMHTDFPQPRLPSGPYSAVIFTSVTAVAALGQFDHSSLPKHAICVGKATAERARNAGFAAVSADGAADALISHVVSLNSGGRLLHLRGEVARGEVAARLSALGVPTDEVVVYRQLAQPLNDAAVAVLRRKGPVIVPFFSPRSARLFQDALPQGLCADLYLAMMSNAAAEAGSRIPARHVIVASRPEGDSMLDAIGNLLDRIAPP